MKPLICLAACLIGISLPCQASSLFTVVELSDVQLAELRGRYVLPDRVIHFGVTMNSIWQNAAGETVGASVGFQLDEHSQPTLYVTTLDASGSAAPPAENSAVAGAGQVIGGAGLGQVSGISQSVRSAGDFNEGLNDLQMVVTRGGQLLVSAEGAVPWDGSGTASVEGAAGRVVISALGGGLQMQIDAGSQGMAIQKIGAGSIIQQANFTGNLNRLHNQATLNFALRDMTMGQGFVNCTLEQLRALRPAGY